jgi:hypothetical protein
MFGQFCVKKAPVVGPGRNAAAFEERTRVVHTGGAEDAGAGLD